MLKLGFQAEKVHAEHADKLESVAVKIWLPFVLL
jgi:hypothetical protein